MWFILGNHKEIILSIALVHGKMTRTLSKETTWTCCFAESICSCFAELRIIPSKYLTDEPQYIYNVDEKWIQQQQKLINHHPSEREHSYINRCWVTLDCQERQISTFLRTRMRHELIKVCSPEAVDIVSKTAIAEKFETNMNGKWSCFKIAALPSHCSCFMMGIIHIYP